MIDDSTALLVRYGVKLALCKNEFLASRAIEALRVAWPSVEDYDRRQIMVEIEVALMREEREPIAMREEWQKLRDELRGPKTPFTVDYRCGKCKRGFLKLWRGVHGCKDKDGHELLCAACLAPGVEVDAAGCAQSKVVDMRTDQVNGWLPAIPTDDTYWGYSSSPSQDVEWWQALPTYRSRTS